VTDSSKQHSPALLGVLSCQIALRPAGAPHFADLAAALRDVRREGAELVLTYAEAARDTLTQVVAAERLCCASIGWEIDDVGATLRVRATPEQLDLLEGVARAGRGTS